jgi:hypothetical protein
LVPKALAASIWYVSMARSQPMHAPEAQTLLVAHGQPFGLLRRVHTRPFAVATDAETLATLLAAVFAVFMAIFALLLAVVADMLMAA